MTEGDVKKAAEEIEADENRIAEVDVNDPTVSIKIRTYKELSDEETKEICSLVEKIIKILAPDKTTINLANFAAFKDIFFMPRFDVMIPTAIFLGVTPNSKYFHRPKINEGDNDGQTN